jgi:serine/threonine-protein kinase HipA
MRPKCTLLDTDGGLALGKFPSVGDERAVTRGEVLALHVARNAGVQTADARIVLVNQQPVAVIRRFDRTADQSRLPYMSGATLLQANRQDELSYTQLVDAMRSVCADFANDARQLWRRLVLNHLITNVDDHLQNIGFLYTGRKQWQLAPAFDLNPFPDKSPESKTWLSEDTGPITSIDQLLSKATYFELTPPQAEAVVAEVKHAVKNWKAVAASPDVGMQAAEMKAFEAAFKEAFV